MRSVEVTFGDGFDSDTLRYTFKGMVGLTVNIDCTEGEVIDVSPEGILLDVPHPGHGLSSQPKLIPWDDDLGGIVHIHVL